MAKFILHGGRHKSGTTAIQKFLKSNPGLLLQHGFYYPEYGIRGYGHHEIAGQLTRAAMRDASENAEQKRQETAAALRNETSEHSSTFVLSSEAFQNGDPVDIRRFFGEHDCKAVFYIREQTSYLLSAYAQKIQATRYTGSLEEFYYNEFRRGDYDHFLQQWHRVFGKNITIRVYDRNRLLESNVIYDFCNQILGIGLQVLRGCTMPDRANPSLTQHLLEFKRKINAATSIAEEHQRDIYLGLSELALSDQSGPVTITKELAREISNRYRQSNTLVARQFFEREFLFEQPRLPDCVTPGPTVAELNKIRRDLIELRPNLEEVLSSAIKAA